MGELSTAIMFLGLCIVVAAALPVLARSIFFAASYRVLRSMNRWLDKIGKAIDALHVQPGREAGGL